MKGEGIAPIELKRGPVCMSKKWCNFDMETYFLASSRVPRPLQNALQGY